MKRFAIQVVAAAAVGAAFFVGTCYSAEPQKGKAAATQPANGTAAPASVAGSAGLPQPEELVAIIRNTIMAVNHANLTNNYSTLRDLGSPEFKSSQSQETLSKSFEGFRTAKIDAGITAAVMPQLTKAPVLDDKGLLRLTGYYPTRPRIVFDMVFKYIDDRWQHAGIAVGTAAAPPPTNVVDAKSATQPAPQGAPIRDTSKMTTGSIAPEAKKK